MNETEININSETMKYPRDGKKYERWTTKIQKTEIRNEKTRFLVKQKTENSFNIYALFCSIELL